jgi:hypothetical protein
VRLLAAVLENSSDAIVFVHTAGWSAAGTTRRRRCSASRDTVRSRNSSRLSGARRWLTFSCARRSDSRLARQRWQSVRRVAPHRRSDVFGRFGLQRRPVRLRHPVRDVTESKLVRASAAAVAFEPDASAALESLAVVLAYVMPVENLTLTAIEGRGSARRVASAGRCAAKLQTGELLATAGTPLAVGTARRHRSSAMTRAPEICPTTQCWQRPESVRTSCCHCFMVAELPRR